MFFSPNRLLLGFSDRKNELTTLTGRAPELCVRALCLGPVLFLSFSCPSLVLLSCSCPSLVLLLSSGRAGQPPLVILLKETTPESHPSGGMFPSSPHVMSSFRSRPPQEFIGCGCQPFSGTPPIILLVSLVFASLSPLVLSSPFGKFLVSSPHLVLLSFGVVRSQLGLLLSLACSIFFLPSSFCPLLSFSCPLLVFLLSCCLRRCPRQGLRLRPPTTTTKAFWGLCWYDCYICIN